MRAKFFALAVLVLVQAAYALEGDVDGDGKVSSTDALLALKMAVGKLLENAIADVDRDGRITTADAARILVIAAGKKNESKELFEILKGSVESYNKNLDKVPGAVKTIFGNERIDWSIALKDGTLRIGVLTKDGAVVEFKEGGISEPTIKLHSSEAAIRRILESQDPLEEYQKALNSNEVSYEGVGAVKKVKLFFVGLAGKILGRFL